MSAARPWITLLFRFEGRISQRAFWVGLAIVVAAGILLATVILPLLVGPRLTMALAPVLVAPSLFAVTTKRFHDIDYSWWWNLLFGLPLGFTWVSHFSGLFPNENVNAVTLYWAVVTLITGLWCLARLGFRPGMHGYNDYGPDPLQAQVQAPPESSQTDRSD